MKFHSGILVAAVACVALLIAGGAALYAVNANRDDVVSAAAANEQICSQVLKLRDAELKNVDLFEAAVKDGWVRRDPGDEVTPAERVTAERFFAGQRATLQKVICP